MDPPAAPTPSPWPRLQHRLVLALEGLWLAVVGLTPVVFAPSDSILGTQMPKVATVRILAAAMLVLLTAIWALGPVQGLPTMTRMRTWLAEHPARWLVVGAAAVFGAHVLSTLLSAIWRVSIWGKTPGLDGYPVYTVAAFGVIFFTIASRVRTPQQVWRLVGVIVASGVVVAALATAQRFGADPFNLGYDGARVNSTLGNPIFAADLLLLTTLLSAGAAAGHYLADGRLRVAALWWPVLALQAAAIVFTFSRGPWLGFAVGALVFGVVALLAGRRFQVKPLATLFAPAFVLAVLLAVLPSGSGAEDASPTGALGAAAATIPSSVTTDGLSTRVWAWEGSLRVFGGRLWFEGERDSLSLLRPIVGYGPEVFRNVFPLGSPPELAIEAPGVFSYAHNYYLHLLVENGLLGAAAFVGLMGAALAASFRMLRRRKAELHDPAPWLAAGLLAAIAGWLIAALTAIPRIADLTVLWAMLGLLTALCMMQARGQEPASEAAPATERRSARRRRSRAARTSGVRWSALGVAIAVLVLGGWFSWVKNVDYLLAAGAADSATEAVAEGDLERALPEIDRAIAFAPDVTHYLLLRGRIFESAVDVAQSDQEREWLAEQARLSFREAWLFNPHSARETYALAKGTILTGQNSGSPRLQEGLGLLMRLRDQLPNDFRTHEVLGANLRLQGMPSEALAELDRAIELSGDTPFAAPSHLLRSFALWDLGRPEEAARAGERAIDLGLTDADDRAEAFRFLAGIHLSLGNDARAGELLAAYRELTGLDP